MSLKRLPVQSWLTAGMLTGLFALVGYVVPGLRFFFSLVWAVPIVFTVKRHGLTPGVLAVLMAGIIVGISLGPLLGIAAILEIGSLALVMGLLYKNAVPAKRIILLSAVVAMVVQLTTFLVIYTDYDINNPQVKQELAQQRAAIKSFYQQMGVVGTTEGGTEVEQLVDQVLTLSYQLTPGTTVIFAFLAAVANYKFAYWYFSRRRQTLPPDLPLSLWRFPWYTIWGLIIGLSLLLLSQRLEALEVVAKNVVLVSLFFNFVIGLAVISYYLFRTSIPKLLKAALILMLFLYYPIAVILLLIVGTFDPVLNFRRLPAEIPEP